MTERNRHSASTRAKRSRRLDGQSPPRRCSKSSGSSRESGHRSSSSKRHRRSSRKPRLNIPAILIGVLLLTALVALLNQDTPETAPPATQTTKTKKELPATQASQHTRQSPLEIAQTFLSTQDPSQRLNMVRNRSEVINHMATYPTQALSEATTNLEPLDAVHHHQFWYAQFLATFANGDQRLLSIVTNTESPQVSPQVDWDSFARYGTSSWKDLLRGQEASADVRVFVKRANYYNASFADESIWIGCVLSSPDLEQPVYAYAKRDSKTGKIIAQELGHDQGPEQRLTLRISTTKKDIRWRQFTLEKVLSLGWVRANQDFEDSWTPSLLSPPELGISPDTVSLHRGS